MAEGTESGAETSYICKLTNGDITYDISDAVVDIEVTKGRGVKFLSAEVYVYKQIWASLSFWTQTASAVDSSGQTVDITASNIPTLKDNETLISINCYCGKYDNLVLKQSATSGNYYVFQCYTPAVKLKGTALSTISPQLQVIHKREGFTKVNGATDNKTYQFKFLFKFPWETKFQTVGYAYTSYDEGIGKSARSYAYRQTAHFEECPLFQGATLSSDPLPGPSKDTYYGVWNHYMDIKSICSTTINGVLQTLYTPGFRFTLPFTGWSETGQSIYSRYNLNDVKNNSSKYRYDEVKDDKGNVIEYTITYLCADWFSGTANDLLTYISVCAGFKNTVYTMGFAYWPLIHEDNKMDWDSTFYGARIFPDEVPLSFISNASQAPLTKAEIDTTLEVPTSGVGRYNPVVRFNPSADMLTVLENIALLTNRYLFFSDTLYCVSAVRPDAFYVYDSTNKKYSIPTSGYSTGQTYIDHVENLNISLGSSGNQSSYVMVDVNGNKKTYPLNWTGEAICTDTGSENLIWSQTVAASDGHRTFSISNDKGDAKVGEVINVDAPGWDLLDTQLGVMALNSLVRNYTAKASFSFSIIESSNGESGAATYKATYFPYANEPKELPTSIDWEGRYAIIYDGEGNDQNDLYVRNESGWTIVEPREGDTCEVINTPYESRWTCELQEDGKLKWIYGSGALKKITRNATFKDFAWFDNVTNTQLDVSTAESTISDYKGLQISYATLSYPSCITTYVIGNVKLTDTEQVLSDIKTSVSEKINQNVIASTISDSTQSRLVFGDQSSMAIASSDDIKNTSFNGIILGKPASAASATLTGYKGGIRQVRITSGGEISCGTYFDGTSGKELGDAVILNKDGLTTYAYNPEAEDDDGAIIKQCEVNTKGELIAGGYLYKLDKNGLSYNFNTKSDRITSPTWNNILEVRESDNQVWLNGDIHADNVTVKSLSADCITSGSIAASTDIVLSTETSRLLAGKFKKEGDIKDYYHVILNGSGLCTYDVDNVLQCSIGRDGAITAGSGTVKLNQNGIKGYDADNAEVFSLANQSLSFTDTNSESDHKISATIFKDRVALGGRGGKTLFVTKDQILFYDKAYINNDGSITGDSVASVASDGISGLSKNSVGSDQLQAESVVARSIAENAVDAKNIIDDAVTTTKIKDAAITNAKIGQLAVKTANIADLAITDAKIADATITTAKISSLEAGKITAGYIAANTSIVLNKSGAQLKAGEFMVGGVKCHHVVLDGDGLRTYNGSNELQCSVNNEGKITAGGGSVVLDSDGLTTYSGTTQQCKVGTDGAIVAGNLNATGIKIDSNGLVGRSNGESVFSLGSNGLEVMGKITSGSTISGSTISGGSISGATITAGNGSVVLNANGLTTYSGTTQQCKVGTDGAFKAGQGITLDSTGLWGGPNKGSKFFSLTTDALEYTSGTYTSRFSAEGISVDKNNKTYCLPIAYAKKFRGCWKKRGCKKKEDFSYFTVYDKSSYAQFAMFIGMINVETYFANHVEGETAELQGTWGAPRFTFKKLLETDVGTGGLGYFSGTGNDIFPGFAYPPCIFITGFTYKDGHYPSSDNPSTYFWPPVIQSLTSDYFVAMLDKDYTCIQIMMIGMLGSPQYTDSTDQSSSVVINFSPSGT